MPQKPQVRISYNLFLEPIYQKIFAVKNVDTGKTFPETKALFAQTDAYRAEWKKYEEKILSAMCDMLQLDFSQNTIDVHTAYAGASFSNPMVIGLRQCVDRAPFVDLLTHEILHRLLTDNTSRIPAMDIWTEMFPAVMSHMARVHILVHAMHQYIYVDVLGEPLRLEHELAFWDARVGSAYKESWDHVRAHGYTNIVEEFKSHYLP